MLEATELDMAFIAPSILEELTKSPSSKARLEKLTAVAFGGGKSPTHNIHTSCNDMLGPLARPAGASICHQTQTLNCFGSTESAVPPHYKPDPEDWEYMYYNPIHRGFEFRPVGDGTYEMVIVRHPSTDHYHATWYTFPDKQEFPTSDLYTKHASKPHLWLNVGRADDTIVFSNTGTFNPTGFEATLREHPSVQGALVVGQARHAAAVIIELKASIASSMKTAEDRARFVDELWPYVEVANNDAPGYARVAQDKIILSLPAKPFLRAGKGTVQRRITVAAYKEEIDQIYRRSEEDVQLVDLPKIDVSREMESLNTDIENLVESVVGIKCLEPDQDFFAAGMDSLHVMTIIKQLKSCLVGVPSGDINTRLVYANPTISKLVAALKAMSTSNGTSDETLSTKSREQKMKDTLDEYIKQLPAPSENVKKASRRNGPLTVILTGSTGSLGSYLLHTLLSKHSVSKIYCLNRRPDSGEQQAKTNASYGLASKWDNRVEFLHADLSKPNLGLSDHDYTRLKNEVSVIIRMSSLFNQQQSKTKV